MTEPPRPPGDGIPDDPTAPANPYAANDPNFGSAPPPPPPYGAPQGPGYGAPPPPGYGPPPQYGAPPQYGYGAPPPGSATDDKTWVLVAHVGGAGGMLIGGGTLGWVAPLVAMLARGSQSPFVRAEAVKALNFQLLLSIIATACWLLFCLVVTPVIATAAMVLGIIFGVIAGVKANNGEPYNYPFNISIVK